MASIERTTISALKALYATTVTQGVIGPGKTNPIRMTRVERSETRPEPTSERVELILTQNPKLSRIKNELTQNHMIIFDAKSEMT